jgi:hypothetical protein
MNTKGVERVVAVAFPRLQYRVADSQSQHTHHIANPHSQKWLRHIWLRAYPRFISVAEVKHQNTIFGKYSRKAATAFNGHIAKIAALSWVKITKGLSLQW